MKKARLREIHSLPKATQQVSWGAHTPHNRGPQWMRIFHLLYLVALFYFSGWMKKYLSCCPMKFKTYKLDKKYLSCSPMKFKTHKVFWCFLLRIMAALFACCFQVAFLFSSSPFSRPIFYPFLFKAFKGLSSTGPTPRGGTCAVLIENRGKSLC